MSLRNKAEAVTAKSNSYSGSYALMLRMLQEVHPLAIVTHVCTDLQTLGRLEQLSAVDCTVPGTLTFCDSVASTVNLDYMCTTSQKAWNENLRALHTVYQLYSTAVRASHIRRPKYPVREDAEVTGWDFACAIPYKVALAYLNLCILICYQHQGFKAWLLKSGYFYWLDRPTGVVLYAKKCV